MVLASDYPFLNIFWTMIIFFFWVMWFWCLIVVLSDVFRRHDIGGWHKAFWVAFVIFLPLLGVLIYLIADGKGMAERRTQDVVAQKQATDEYIRSVATTPAGNGGG